MIIISILIRKLNFRLKIKCLLMVRVLVPRSSSRGLSPGRGHCVVFMDKTIYPLSTQENKWVPANCWENLTNCLGVTSDGLASHSEGVEMLLAASCYRNRDKFRQLIKGQSASRLHFINFNVKLSLGVINVGVVSSKVHIRCI